MQDNNTSNGNMVEFETKEGIIIARFSSDKPITLEVAKNLVLQRKAYTQNKPFKIIFVFPKITSMDKGGRDYLSTDEAKEGVIASAIVTKSVLGRVIINFFLKLNDNDKDNFPNKVFNNEEDAFNWIKDINVN